MSNYISREAAIESLVEYYNSMVDFVGYGTPKKNAVGECIERLKNDIPAADVRPVVRGTWKSHKTKTGKNWWKCSACDYVSEHKAHHNFCPNCGADMREEP